MLTPYIKCRADHVRVMADPTQRGRVRARSHFILDGIREEQNVDHYKQHMDCLHDANVRHFLQNQTANSKVRTESISN